MQCLRLAFQAPLQHAQGSQVSGKERVVCWRSRLGWGHLDAQVCSPVPVPVKGQLVNLTCFAGPDLWTRQVRVTWRCGSRPTGAWRARAVRWQLRDLGEDAAGLTGQISWSCLNSVGGLSLASQQNKLLGVPDALGL